MNTPPSKSEHPPSPSMPDHASATHQADLEPVVTVEGTVSRIVYENPENGFFVARLQEHPATEPVTFVGNLMAISPGETVRLRGRWVEDKRFGKQLRVETCEVLLPGTVQGIEKYLGSGLISGIGPKYAKALVNAFGVETLRVIDEQPERLRSVEGIGPKRAAQIREAWASQRALQDIMIFLQGHGISPAQATKIYRYYKEGALAILRANPYRLAEDIPGIGFRGADKIAASIGIAADAPPRLEAGLLHALNQAAGDGHCFLPVEELRAQAAELLGVAPDALEPVLQDMAARRKLVLEGDAAWLPRLHSAEVEAAGLLKRLIATPLERVSIHIENALRWAELKQQIAFSPEQREAITQAITAKVIILTGGPGTGKTTIIRSLLGILERKGLAYLLAAPTGRAAKRMELATGQESRTLHRLLEYSPMSGSFSRNEFNPLNTDLVIVDEASMIDIHLMHCLLKALPPFTRLILVGDVDQLPSVGPGSVLFDCIASQAAPVVRLQTIFRQAAESGIIRAAHQINAGHLPGFNQEDFFLIERTEPRQALETIVHLVTERIPKHFKLDPLRDIQVLSPMRRGEAGVNQLNETLQAALNPHGAPVPRRNLRVGDKVMQLKNNYELEVYNGDVGILSHLDVDAGELEVTFDDGRAVLYPLDEADSLGLAYAATVHKSQGSEYPAVVMPFLPQHYMLLQRNVLYTGITRGKQLVLLVGDKKAVGMAVRNNRINRRNTRLAERLRNRL